MKQQDQPTGGARSVLAIAAFVLAPWVLRAVSLADEGLSPVAADLRGFGADLGIACLLALLCWPLGRLWRGLGALAAAAFAILAAANFQTIAALGSVAALGDSHFLGDRTFVAGSVLEASRPALMVGLAVAAGALAWFGLGALRLLPALSGGVAGLVLMAVAVLLPGDAAIAGWRRVNVVQHNVQAALLPTRPQTGWLNPPGAMLELLPELAGNVEGEPRFEWQGRGDNVLLVVLEGLSGAQVEPASRVHGRAAFMAMPELDAIFRQGVGYATFVNHNRRTNRGLYGLLCGELPGLVTGMAKMTEGATRLWRTCLPEVLRDAGYRTVYLQAAPLSFMLKDRFMVQAGFDEVLGYKSLDRFFLRSQWGVDDRAFLDQAADKIAALEQEREPWFLTLLTVGTHHPYTVPPPYDSDQSRSSVVGAFSYLDIAVGEFMERVDALGIRDDTLILFVSDESSGDWGSIRDYRAGRLTQNWGIAMALLPERQRSLVRDPYAQIDVPISILDYLGMADDGRDFFGRSLFRRYPEGRHIFFGNVNQRTIGGLDPDGYLVDCEYEGWRCAQLDVTDGRVFGDRLVEMTPDPDLVDLVREMALRSQPPQASGQLQVPLLSDPDFRVNMRDWQVVYGVSGLSLDPHEWLEVDVEVAASGEGRAELFHYLRLRGKREPLHAVTTIEGGQTLRMRYTVASEPRISELAIRTNVRLVDGWNLDLEYKKRRFVVHRGGERPLRGVHIGSWKVEPPGGPEPRIEQMSVEEMESISRAQNAVPDEPGTGVEESQPLPDASVPPPGAPPDPRVG